MKENYDSKFETREHIYNVRELIFLFCSLLSIRGVKHDKSKLEDPEKPIFDEWTPKLSSVTYGSDEYRDMLEQMKPAIDHHQKNNRHHPEFFKNEIEDMNLIDIVEMFLDWKAATLRHKDGDIFKSIEINQTRFEINDQLCQIFKNTAELLK